MKTHDSSLDLLRLLCTLGIILLHVTGAYLGAATSTEWFGTLYREHMLYSSLLHGPVRAAVPCFIMITGALSIANPANRNFRTFYRKTWKRVGVPLIIFSIVYFFCYLLVYALLAKKNGDATLLLKPFHDLLIGAPGYHLWYLYMMIGVYLLIPIVIRLKEELCNKTYIYISIAFFIMSTISLWQSKYTFYWSPGLSFSYLSYAMLGDVIYSHLKTQKHNGRALLLLALGVLLGLLLGYLRYIQAENSIDDKQLTSELLQPYCPIPVIMSVLIFCGFSLLKLPDAFSAPLKRINQHSLFVYLIHPGILFVVQRFISAQYDCRLTIWVMFFIISICSYLFSIVYLRVENWWGKRFFLR